MSLRNVTFARWLRWLLKISLREVVARGEARWLLKMSLRNVTLQGGCERRIINIVVARGELLLQIMILILTRNFDADYPFLVIL